MHSIVVAETTRSPTLYSRSTARECYSEIILPGEEINSEGISDFRHVDKTASSTHASILARNVNET